jgi:hypothetical protein
MDRAFSRTDYESITVNTAIGFTAAKISRAISGSGRQADYVMVTVETDQIRYRLDGVAPTSSEGHLVAAGDGFEINGALFISNFLAIKVTNNATIRCTYGWYA